MIHMICVLSTLNACAVAKSLSPLRNKVLTRDQQPQNSSKPLITGTGTTCPAAESHLRLQLLAARG